MTTNPQLFLGDDPARIIAKARALAADVERISAGAAPTQAELSAAPLLDHWMVGLLERPVLIGTLTNHPLLGSCEFAQTTDIYALDQVQGWARTWSRFYKLGRPAMDCGRDQ